jgi:protein phosphatase
MQTNQDAAFYAQAGRVSVMLVADGISVSTAGSGNLASALLVQSIASQWESDSTRIAKMTPDGIMSWIEQSLIKGNAKICENSIQLAHGDLSQQIPMGTTAVLAIIRDSVLYLASLGDSRAYLIGDSGVSLLTGDQNVRGLWLCAHKKGNSLPNVADEGFALVGYCGRFDQNTEPSPADPVTRVVKLLETDTVLLCSDGLTDYAAGTIDGQSEVVAEGAAFSDLHKGCRYLIERANEGGGGDNVTVMLARIAND